MKITSLLVLLVCYAFSSTAQQCEQQLERLRTEGRKLSETNNELTRTVAALRQLLIVGAQDRALIAQVSSLKRKMLIFRNDSIQQRRIIADKQKRLDQESNAHRLTTRELAELTEERNATGRALELSKATLKSIAKEIAQKSDSIKILKAELSLYKKLADELDDESKDRIYTAKQLVVFEGRGHRYGQSIFTIHFVKADSLYGPESDVEKTRIRRFVNLISKYSDRVKIHLVVGSKLDDSGFRQTREKVVREYLLSFKGLLSLEPSIFDKPAMLNVSTYNIEVQVVKK